MTMTTHNDAAKAAQYLLETFVPWPIRNYADGCDYASMPERYEAARIALGIEKPKFLHPGNQPTENGPARAPAPFAWVHGDTVEAVLQRIADASN